jgi:hypothetical protein
MLEAYTTTYPGLGFPIAPMYANIFMAVLERELLKKAPNNLLPIEWIRFIDDIFAIWTDDTENSNDS